MIKKTSMTTAIAKELSMLCYLQFARSFLASKRQRSRSRKPTSWQRQRLIPTLKLGL